MAIERGSQGNGAHALIEFAFDWLRALPVCECSKDPLHPRMTPIDRFGGLDGLVPANRHLPAMNDPGVGAITD